MRKIYSILALFMIAVLVCSCGQSLSAKESVAVSCVNDLQSSLVSQRSLELTGDIEFESYLFTDDLESRQDADLDRLSIVDNSAYREYMLIPYAASNKMGVMIDNIAYYQVRLNDDGSYSFAYLGDTEEYNDTENMADHKYISLCRLDRISDSPAFEETISADTVAKVVGCVVNK